MLRCNNNSCRIGRARIQHHSTIIRRRCYCSCSAVVHMQCPTWWLINAGQADNRCQFRCKGKKKSPSRLSNLFLANCGAPHSRHLYAVTSCWDSLHGYRALRTSLIGTHTFFLFFSSRGTIAGSNCIESFYEYEIIKWINGVCALAELDSKLGAGASVVAADADLLVFCLI